MVEYPENGSRDVEQREIWTVEELARYLRLNRKTAYELVATGKVPGVRKIGRIIRISRTAVLRWITGEDRVARNRGES